MPMMPMMIFHYLLIWAILILMFLLIYPCLWWFLVLSINSWDPSNPDRASIHRSGYLSMNWGIGHLAWMIIFLVTEALSTYLWWFFFQRVHAKFMWAMRRLHEWYYLACVCGLQFIEGRIHEEVFKSRSFDLNIEMFELHTIYRLGMLNITMMTVMFTLVHVADDEKSLRFMNPT
jgi:hypothetical protein